MLHGGLILNEIQGDLREEHLSHFQRDLFRPICSSPGADTTKYHKAGGLKQPPGGPEGADSILSMLGVQVRFLARKLGN